MSFFSDMEKSLLEAIEVEKGNIPLVERKEMPALTYYIFHDEEELINRIIKIREEINLTQTELAKMIGSKQQVISRLEKKEHSPSLKLFCSIINAMGYKLEIVKK